VGVGLGVWGGSISNEETKFLSEMVFGGLESVGEKVFSFAGRGDETSDNSIFEANIKPPTTLAPLMIFRSCFILMEKIIEDKFG